MTSILEPPAALPAERPPGRPDVRDTRAAELGLGSSTALVIGSIIGTGVFTMPAVMAGAGTSSIITLAVIAVGAVLLGVMFGQLTKRVPTVDGGLYAYARHEFGDFAGYLTAWCYWITCWAGNAAIVASWVLYNPRRNVGRASVIGTAASGVLYVVVTAVVMGLVPHDELVTDGAPFVAAFQEMFGGAGWIGKAVALVAVVSGIGALNGWTLVTAEMPYAAAKDGLFVRAFAKEDRNGTPWFGIVVSTVVASILMAWSYSGSTGLKVFTYLVYLSVVTAAIPYFISACAQLSYLVSRRRRVQGWQLTRDLAISVTSGLFALWVTFASGYQAVYQAMVLVLIGIPLYAFLKARRERLGLVLEPVDQLDDDQIAFDLAARQLLDDPANHPS